MDAKTYLNNIRDKNDDNSLKYDKMISEIPYITNPKDLEKLKEILEELKTENKDLYDYIISLLKKTDDLNELFLLYKEYKEAKLREEVLDNEVKSKDIEFNNIKEDLRFCFSLCKNIVLHSTNIINNGNRKIAKDEQECINNIISFTDKLSNEDLKKEIFAILEKKDHILLI